MTIHSVQDCLVASFITMRVRVCGQVSDSDVKCLITYQCVCLCVCACVHVCMHVCLCMCVCV